jgi:hypothetical protein
MPISENVTNLADMMDKILERVQHGFEENGVSLPDRQYWQAGIPAADCEQLVVSFSQAYIGPPGDEANEPQRCNSPRTAQVDIQILRCAPAPGKNGKPPTAESLQNFGRLQTIDAYTLLEIACSLDTWDDQFDLGGPGMGVIATVDAGDNEGSFQGPTLHLTVAIP